MTRRRYTDPAPGLLPRMLATVRELRDLHPDWPRVARETATLAGAARMRALEHLRHTCETRRRQHVITMGRTTYTLNDNPATLDRHAEAIARCPGWTGKRAPKPAPSTDYGRITFTHADGWALAIPGHWVQELFPGYYRVADTRGRVLLRIGHVVLHLRVDKRLGNIIEGDVPASWLVDLNAGPIVDEGHDEATQLELAA